MKNWVWIVVVSTLIVSNTYSNTDTRQVERRALQQIESHLEGETNLNNTIEDITASRSPVFSVTAEMAKFYYVVAGIELTNCFLSKDHTTCSSFFESLKDPIGHLGFYLFMKGNHLTVDMVKMISRGKISPGMSSYLGLAGGMLVQSIFTDIYYHQDVRDLFAVNRIEDPTERKEQRRIILNRLWNSFRQGALRYAYNKIPHVAGLLGSAYLANATHRVLGRAVGPFVKLILGPRRATNFLKYGSGLSRSIRIAKSGFVIFTKAGKLTRINPILLVGSELIHTTIFLLWAPIVEDFLLQAWDRSHAANKIGESLRNLRQIVNSDEVSYSLAQENADKFIEGMEEFRRTIMHSAELKKMNHLQNLQNVDNEMEKILIYYDWMLQGMDRESELWKANEYTFHHVNPISAINEANDLQEEFFCGKSASRAVERLIEWHGLPIPFISQEFHYNRNDYVTNYQNAISNEGSFNARAIEVEPFRVLSIPEFCPKNLVGVDGDRTPGPYDYVNCPVESPSRTNRYVFTANNRKQKIACEVEISQARYRALKYGSHPDFTPEEFKEKLNHEFDEKMAIVMEKVMSQREIMVVRYERQIREELLEALSGRSIDMDRRGNIVYGGRPFFPTYRYPRHYLEIPKGVLNVYEWESGIWHELMDNPNVPEHVNRMFRLNHLRMLRKRTALNNLKNYFELNPSERIRSIDIFEVMERADYVQVIQEYRDFIIY